MSEQPTRLFLVAVPDALEPSVTEYAVISDLVKDLKEAIENPGYYYVFRGDRILISSKGRSRYLLTEQPICLNESNADEHVVSDYVDLDSVATEYTYADKVVIAEYEEESAPIVNIPDKDEVDTDSILEDWSDDSEADPK